MRVLLVHPEDSVIEGPWSISRWDLIVDLGWAGTFQYAEWGTRLGCAVRSLFSFATWHEDVPLIPELCGVGKYRLLDSEGIDWWELLAPSGYQRIYDFLLLQKGAREIKVPGEIRITRPHSMGDAIGKILGVNVVPFVTKSERSAIASFIRFKKKLRALTSSQIVQIAFDKWDSGYGVRRYFARRGRSSGSKPKILLPSAYRNVSHVLARYAQLLPDRDFLLVTTRANGELKEIAPPYFLARPSALSPPAPPPDNPTCA